MSVYDGIGGARVALSLLGIEPAAYLRVDDDSTREFVVHRAWPEAVTYPTAELPGIPFRARLQNPALKRGLLICGAPTLASKDPQAFDSAVSSVAGLLKRLATEAPHIDWDCLFEHVAPVSSETETG